MFFFYILKIKTLCCCYQRHRALLHKGNNSYVVAGTRNADEHLNVVLRPQKPSGLVGTGSPGRPLRLSLSSELMDWNHGPTYTKVFLKSQTGLLSKFPFWDSSAKRAQRTVPKNLCACGEKQIGFCRSLPETHTHQEDYKLGNGARVRRWCMLGFF